MHDDQHGTAIISGAALLNALELAGKQADAIRMVVSGAGASAMACMDLYMQLGVRRENIAVFDSKGHVHKGREGLGERKQNWPMPNRRFPSLGAAMEGGGCLYWLEPRRLGQRGNGGGHGRQPDCLCIGQP